MSSALKTVKKVGQVDGIHNQSIEENYFETVRCKLATVSNDSTRPLLADFDSNGMERSGRLRVPLVRANH